MRSGEFRVPSPSEEENEIYFDLYGKSVFSNTSKKVGVVKVNYSYAKKSL